MSVSVHWHPAEIALSIIAASNPIGKKPKKKQNTCSDRNFDHRTSVLADIATSVLLLTICANYDTKYGESSGRLQSLQVCAHLGCRPVPEPHFLAPAHM